MSGVLQALAGIACLAVAALLLHGVMTGDGRWLTRIWPPVWRLRVPKDGATPPDVDFSALVVGIPLGIAGFLLVAGAILSPFL